MPVRQTSIDSYKSLLDKLGAKQRLIYDAFCITPLTNAEVADFLKMPINCVTGRTNELVEMGLVKYAGTKIHPGTHRRQIVWKISNQVEARQIKFF